MLGEVDENMPAAQSRKRRGRAEKGGGKKKQRRTKKMQKHLRAALDSLEKPVPTWMSVRRWLTFVATETGTKTGARSGPADRPPRPPRPGGNISLFGYALRSKYLRKDSEDAAALCTSELYSFFASVKQNSWAKVQTNRQTPYLTLPYKQPLTGSSRS